MCESVKVNVRKCESESVNIEVWKYDSEREQLLCTDAYIRVCILSSVLWSLCHGHFSSSSPRVTPSEMGGRWEVTRVQHDRPHGGSLHTNVGRASTRHPTSSYCTHLSGFHISSFCLFKKSWWKWERVWACPAVFPVRVKHCHWGINSCVSSDGVPACQQAVVFARCKSVKRCCWWWWSAPFLHSPSHSVSGLWRLLSTFFLKIDNVLLSHIFIHWIQGENNTLQGAKNMYITRRKEYITTTRRNQRYTLQGEKKTLIVFFSQVHF